MTPGSYTLTRLPDDYAPERPEVVVYGIAEPRDPHEALLRVEVARAAWAAQGGPERIEVVMLAAAPDDGLCHHPHPTRRGASCTEPAGHAGDDLRGASHGDGTVERWLVR